MKSRVACRKATETQAEIERRAAADLEAGGEVGTEGGADRGGDLRCYGEVVDAAAALGEAEPIG